MYPQVGSDFLQLGSERCKSVWSISVIYWNLFELIRGLLRSVRKDQQQIAKGEFCNVVVSLFLDK